MLEQSYHIHVFSPTSASRSKLATTLEQLQFFLVPFEIKCQNYDVFQMISKVVSYYHLFWSVFSFSTSFSFRWCCFDGAVAIFTTE